MELTTLKGTEKQVNWAKTIRKDRLKVWQAADSAGFQLAEAMLSQQGASSWWITCRDKSLQQACGQLAAGAKSRPPAKGADPGLLQVATMAWGAEETWETVVTATGFRRSGPTRDMATGAIVHDAALPF